MQSEGFESSKNFFSNALCRAVKFQVKLDTSSSKKKLKLYFYQRHKRKVDITSLINGNPGSEFVSTRGRAGGTTPTGSNDTAEDPSKNADEKGRGRGRKIFCYKNYQTRFLLVFSITWCIRHKAINID